MLRGLHTATAGMITEQRKHDAITNNIANINTAGYKSQAPAVRSFPEMLISLMHNKEDVPRREIGRLNTGVMVEENVPVFTQGDLVETGNAGDIALFANLRLYEEVDGEQVELRFDASGKAVNANGEIVYQPQAFFTLINEEGERRYTRNGEFRIGFDGTLQSADGLRVLNQMNEPIQLNQPLEQVRITSDGRLVDAESGEWLTDEFGAPIRIQISQINNPYDLRREGNGLFRLENEEADPPIMIEDFANVELKQGFIERSNVDAGKMMVELNTVLRAYEANQKVIQFYDRSLDKAVNEIGRIHG